LVRVEVHLSLLRDCSRQPSQIKNGSHLLVFWIANGLSIFGPPCRRQSQYYCLDGYHTLLPINGGYTRFSNGLLDREASKAWFTILIKAQWHTLNMINPHKPQECCGYQLGKYMIYGLAHKQMSPDKYMDRLSNYDDEDRPLNLIAAMYVPSFCQNMILEVGFGPGNFRRSHHPNVREGAPYLLAGMELGQIGIPFIMSVSFDYHNVTEELTFHWFKHNIMCKEKPWICAGNKRSKPASKQTPVKSASKPRKTTGNKKAQRKSRQH
ncbi:uncharacterized protein LOC142334824, partial [Convolutriloba macropyga]|uniref:uncharacterized protein LOC142334824 n=1 Tax=Convolutriloba macropyga TaxID=536237 RepID=UPI003F526770